MVFSRGEPLQEGARRSSLVDELFAEIDRFYAAGKTRRAWTSVRAAEAAGGSPRTRTRPQMTPERLAALEEEAARLDEDDSPVAGRRFTRA